MSDDKNKDAVSVINALIETRRDGEQVFKAAVSSDDDQAILDECERGEDYARKAYADALGKALHSNLRPLVVRQADDVRAAHDTVRDLRNQHLVAEDTNPST